MLDPSFCFGANPKQRRSWVDLSIPDAWKEQSEDVKLKQQKNSN
jgi:hypothetical protein